jgi:hypothetical protein
MVVGIAQSSPVPSSVGLGPGDRSLKRPRPPYRLDCRDCGKDSGKEEVAHCKRETTAKSSESRKREQLLQSWVHFGSFISPTPVWWRVRLPILIA